MRTFLLLGSGEFEPWTHEVERVALASAAGDGSVRDRPHRERARRRRGLRSVGSDGLDHYAEAGVVAEVLPVRTREDALRPELAARAAAASIVYFSGGKPAHLAGVLHGSPLLDAILGAMDRGAVWAGCSAGAMVVSRARVGGTAGASWRSGLGLVPNAVVGVHWDRMGRIPGAAWWMSSRLPDGTRFVGIDERTAILGDGERWTVYGLGGVTARRDGATATLRAGATFETR